MSIVKIYDKKDLSFVNVKDIINDFIDIRHTENLNGEEVFSFTIPFKSDNGIEEDDLIDFNGNKFIITRITRTHDNNGLYTQIEAEGLYALLINKVVSSTEGDTWLPGATFRDVMERALIGTSFELGTVDDFGTWDIEMGDRSALEVLGELRESWTGIVATPSGNTTRTGPATNLNATLVGNQAQLTWIDPSDIDWERTKLVVNTGNYPINDSNGTIVVNSTNRNANNGIPFNYTLPSYGSYYFKLFTIDRFGNVNSAGAITNVLYQSAIDTTPPANVTSVVESHGTNKVVLGWVNPKNVDFSHVKVYKNDVLLGTSITERYEDNGLTSGTSYAYKLTSVDTSGNESNGVTITVTTSLPVDVLPPANVTNLTEIHSASNVTLSWTNPADTDFSKIKVYRNSSLIATLGRASTYNDSGLQSGFNYTYKITTVDSNGNESSGVTISATTTIPVDSDAPKEITNLIATSTTTTTALSWRNPSDSDFVKVKIYKDNVFLTELEGVNYTVTGLTLNTSYTFKLTTFDNEGNESQGVSVSVTTPLTNDSTPPANVTALSETHTDKHVRLNWSNPADADFSHANIYRNNILIAQLSSVADYSDYGLQNGTTYTYKVTSVDKAGNESTGTTKTVTTDAVDIYAPEVVIVSEPAVTENSVVITWTKPEDPDFEKVKIYRDTRFIAESTDTIYVDNDLQSNKTYSYEVKSLDSSGNASAAIVIEAQTLAGNVVTPPTYDAPPANVTNLAETHTTTTSHITWTNPTDVDFAKVRVYRDNVLKQETTGTSFDDTNLIINTAYAYKVTSVDTAGNESSGVVVTLITTVPKDTTPPSDVSSVSNLAGTNTVTLSWTKPGNADFRYTKIYRDGEFLVSTSRDKYIDGGLEQGTSYDYKLTAVDVDGNESDGIITTAITTVFVDTTPPKEVSNINQAATSNSIHLTWINPTSDFVNVNVYRNGAYIASGNITSHDDTNLTAGATYIYRITTVDALGNESDGVSFQITTQLVLDTTPPANVGNVTASSTPNSITLRYTKPNDVDFKHLKIYRNDVLIATNLLGEEYTSSGLSPNTSYTFRITSVDFTGNESVGAIINYTTQVDNTPPKDVTDLTSSVTDSSVTLTWKKPTDSDFSHIKVYRGVQTVGTGITGTTFTENSLVASTGYNYIIVTVDINGNESRGMSIIATTSSDVTSPDDVTSVTETHSDHSATLNWNNPSQSDFAYVNIYRNNLYQTSVTNATTWTDNSWLADETTYTYKITSVDTLGNESLGVSINVRTDKDTTPPGEVTGLVENHTDVTIELSWTNPTDKDFNWVKIYKDGAYVTSTLSTSYKFTGLIASTTYRFKLTTIDVDGNESIGKQLTITTSQDTHPPGEVTGLTETHTTNSVTLNWVNPVDSDFSKVNIYKDGYNLVAVVSSPGTSKQITGLTDSTTYNYILRTVDTLGNESFGTEISITTVDGTPPAEVSGLSETHGADSIALTWTTPSDSDFTKVKIYRDNIFLAEMTGTTNTVYNYNDQDLEDGETYKYRITTLDVLGNESAGAILDVFLPDITPPANITGLVGTPSYTSINYTWTNPVEDFKEVKIYTLTDVFVASTPNSSYNMTGLNDNDTYTFKFKAVDFAGNESTGIQLTKSTLDHTPPGDVTSISVSNVTALSTNNSATLNWTNPFDNDFDHVEITGTSLSTPVQIGGIKGFSYQYNLTGLEDGATYGYTIKAVDISGNKSTGITGNFTIADYTPPAEATNVRIDSTTETGVNIFFDSPSDVDFNGARLYNGVTGLNSVSASPGQVNIPISTNALTPNTNYSLTLKMKDSNNNYSTGVPVTFKTLADTTPPQEVTNVTSTSYPIYIDLSWTQSSEAANYKIYRDNALIATIVGSSSTYSATGLAQNTQYIFKIVSVDAAGNESNGVIYPVSTTGDSTPPGDVSNVTESVSMTSATFSWTKPIDVDFNGIKVYKDGVYVATIGTVNSYSVGSLTVNTNYSYKFTTVDSWGNESVGVTRNIKTLAEISDLSNTPFYHSFNLEWTNPTHPNFVKARIWDGTTLLGETTGNSYTVNWVNANTTKTYKVTAYFSNGETTGITTSGTTLSAPGVGEGEYLEFDNINDKNFYFNGSSSGGLNVINDSSRTTLHNNVKNGVVSLIMNQFNAPRAGATLALFAKVTPGNEGAQIKVYINNVLKSTITPADANYHPYTVNLVTGNNTVKIDFVDPGSTTNMKDFYIDNIFINYN